MAMVTWGNHVSLPALPQTNLNIDHLHSHMPHLPATPYLFKASHSSSLQTLSYMPFPDPQHGINFPILFNHFLSQLSHHKNLLLTPSTSSKPSLLLHYMIFCHSSHSVVEYLCKKKKKKKTLPGMLSKLIPRYNDSPPPVHWSHTCPPYQIADLL